MALLRGWLSSQKREERAVLRALADLSDRRIPVRLESESTGVNFFTIVSLRKNGLLVATPRSLRGGLRKGAMVRLTLTNHGRKQVRVPVLVPHVKLPMSVKHACICGLPDAFSGVCQRGADRFSTTRYKNLLLQLPDQQKSFRLVDLSATGMRIFTGEQSGLMLFQDETPVAPARLRVGQRAVIELEHVAPRYQTDNTVGLAMEVKRDGPSGRFLVNLLNRLQEQELARLRIDTV